jgi:hypothetical protein
MFKWRFTSVGHTAEPGIHPHWCSQITTHLATRSCPEGRVTLFRWLHTRPLPATHASAGYRRRNGGFLRRDRLKRLLTRLHVAHMDTSRLPSNFACFDVQDWLMTVIKRFCFLHRAILRDHPANVTEPVQFLGAAFPRGNVATLRCARQFSTPSEKGAGRG